MQNHEPEEGFRLADSPRFVPPRAVVGVQGSDRDGVDGSDGDGDSNVENGVVELGGDAEWRGEEG